MTATAIRNSVKCTKCKRTFDTNAGLSSHLRLVHKITGIKLAAPKKKTGPPSFFNATIKCPHCPMLFKRRTGLGAHLRAVHGVAGQSKTTIKYHRMKNAAAQPVQEMLPTLEQTADAGEAIPASEPLPSEKHAATNTPFACDRCDESFDTAAHLGRHRRFSHGILGRTAQRAIENAQSAVDAPKRRGRPPGSATKRQESQLQLTERATPDDQKLDRSHENSHAVLDPLAYAFAVGSIKEFCRHFAEEHGIPTRQFTRQCAELFSREARR